MALLLQDCRRRETKLFGLLAAAGMIASHSIKGIPRDQWEKYAVVTLTDCRSILDPVLSSNHIGKFIKSLVIIMPDVYSNYLASR